VFELPPPPPHALTNKKNATAMRALTPRGEIHFMPHFLNEISEIISLSAAELHLGKTVSSWGSPYGRRGLGTARMRTALSERSRGGR